VSAAVEIERLHGIFCELTGQEGFSLRFGRDRVWWDWMRCGWGEEELRLVVRYLRRGIADGRRNPGALKFSNLIGQPDRFEEDLAEARRVLGARKPKPQYIPATQSLPGGGERSIVVPRDSEEDCVDVSTAFAELRKALDVRNA
jgi:hypothetical protein